MHSATSRLITLAQHSSMPTPDSVIDGWGNRDSPGYLWKTPFLGQKQPATGCQHSHHLCTDGGSGAKARGELHFSPELDDFDADIASGQHFIETGPFEGGVDIVLAGREVGGWKSQFGKPRSIGPAADDG